MEKKICKVCGIEFECSRMSKAFKTGVCHLCNTNLKTDLYILRGQIGQIKDNEKLKEQLLERINIVENKLTKDVPRTGVFKKENFTDDNIRNENDEEDFDTSHDDDPASEKTEEPKITRNKKQIYHFHTKNSLGNDAYACNFAVGVTKSKLTKDVNKVTCKNCLRVLKRI